MADDRSIAFSVAGSEWYFAERLASVPLFATESVYQKLGYHTEGGELRTVYLRR